MIYPETDGTKVTITEEGLAIASKFPILETSLLKLTRNFSDEEGEHSLSSPFDNS
jgi:hypothetical protein